MRVINTKPVSFSLILTFVMYTIVTFGQTSVKCGNFGDYPEDYEGKFVKMSVYYDSDDNTGSYKEREYSAAYNKYVDVTRYGSKALEFHSQESNYLVKDEVYKYEGKRYYYRRFSCTSAPDVKVLIPVGLRVPKVGGGWVNLSGKVVNSGNNITTEKEGWERLSDMYIIIVSSIERP